MGFNSGFKGLSMQLDAPPLSNNFIHHVPQFATLKLSPSLTNQIPSQEIIISYFFCLSYNS